MKWKQPKLWLSLGLLLLLVGIGWYWWRSRPLTTEEIQEVHQEQRLQLKEADAILDEWKAKKTKYQQGSPSPGDP